MRKIRIGLIREGKIPLDSRVALTPAQCKELLSRFPTLEIYLQPSRYRCFTAQEYSACGAHLREELRNCDILMGIKEVPVSNLVSGKTYMFFSHTIKKQPQNKELLKNIIIKNIELIDYECLTNDKGERLAGFGHMAGVIGAHYAVWVWGKRTKKYNIKRAVECADLQELKSIYKKFKLPPFRVALTGSGRVAGGAAEMLDGSGFRRVTPDDYVKKNFREAVYVQLEPGNLYKHKKNKPFNTDHYYKHPGEYKSAFLPYAGKTDVLVNGLFWNPSSPQLFTKEQMRAASFSIRSIIDISCDVNGALPSTLKSCSIEDPLYGYDPAKDMIVSPFQNGCVDVLAVDNLPNELPRDSSAEFGNDMVKNVIPLLITDPSDEVIQRAVITREGELMPRYQYLKSYAGI